jgi:ribosome biogenesis GTPase / thiamine phosphate phosphatase
VSAPGPVLVAHGWDDRVDAAWAGGPAGRVPGRIVRVDRGECDVVTEDGVTRALSDSKRSQGAVAPATGDWVALVEEPGLGWVIDEVLPRANTLVRRDPGEQGVEQVLVANIDVVLVVHGLDRPMPPGRLERFLVIAEDSGANAIVVLTKADLARVADPAGVDETVAIVRALAPGVPVLLVDALHGVGTEPVEERLDAGATVALVGASGAGKSTLVNALVGDEVQATAEVRGSDAKGRHTTVARELVRRPAGGLLIDTPGVRAVGIIDAEEAIERVFGDIEDLAPECRFSDCFHDAEPGCAVLAAVEAGTLDARRVARYRALLVELAELRDRQLARERRATRDRQIARDRRAINRSGRRPGR